MQLHIKHKENITFYLLFFLSSLPCTSSPITPNNEWIAQLYNFFSSKEYPYLNKKPYLCTPINHQPLVPNH